MTCSISFHHPVVRWWPQLKLKNGTVLYDMVCLGERERAVWFMLEFLGEERARNPADLRLQARRITVRCEWFGPDVERLAEHIRRKALEWLEMGARSTAESLLRDQLRAWAQTEAVALNPNPLRCTQWTRQEEQRLLDGYAKGTSFFQLARAHGRTCQAVRSRLTKLRRTRMAG